MVNEKTKLGSSNQQWCGEGVGGATPHTTLGIALYIHTPTDTHFKLAMPQTPPPSPFYHQTKEPLSFPTHTRSHCVFVWVCAYECVLEQKGPSRCNFVWTATAAIQPTGKRSFTYGRSVVRRYVWLAEPVVQQLREVPTSNHTWTDLRGRFPGNVHHNELAVIAEYRLKWNEAAARWQEVEAVWIQNSGECVLQGSNGDYEPWENMTHSNTLTNMNPTSEKTSTIKRIWEQTYSLNI